MFKKIDKVLLAHCPRNDGIGRYVINLSKSAHIDVSYSKNILSPLNLFKVYFRRKVVHFPHFVVPIFKMPWQKFVTTIQDITPLLSTELSPIKRSYIFLRIVVSLHRSDHIIFTSEYVARCCKEMFNMKFDYSIIPLGVDFDFFSSGIQGSRFTYPYFLIVGRRNKHKNIINMLKAFSQARIDKRTRIVFTGPLSNNEHELDGSIKKLGLKNRAVFLEKVTDRDLVILYNNAKALLFVSKLEGFGLPILEAMSAKCPVVTSKSASLPEVAGDCAILVDPHNIIKIRQAIETCDQKKFSKVMLSAAQNRASTFTWERTVQKTLFVYKKVTGGIK